MTRLYYDLDLGVDPSSSNQLKIETNTIESTNVMGLKKIPFSVNSSWFSGEAKITTYAVEEILGSKFQALIDRDKGRDLFDLAKAIEHDIADPEKIVECFKEYMKEEKEKTNRFYVMNEIRKKVMDEGFRSDISGLLPKDNNWNIDEAFELVAREIIGKLPRVFPDFVNLGNTHSASGPTRDKNESPDDGYSF